MHIISHGLVEVANPEVLHWRTGELIVSSDIDVYGSDYRNQCKHCHDKDGVLEAIETTLNQGQSRGLFGHLEYVVQV